MAGILHPLQLSVLNIIIHWCIMQAGAVQVFPDSCNIYSAAEYEDQACYPASSLDRSSPRSIVTCFRRQSTSAAPKLYDNELGQKGLPSPPTDVAYTLSGNVTGVLETWIGFVFVGYVSLSRVTLHYYCTGTPPQLQLVDALGMVTSTMTPSCGDTAHRQSLTVYMSSFTEYINLVVKRNGGYFYLTEVQFFNEPTPDPATTNAVFIQPSQTPSTSSPTSISVSAQRSTTLRMTVAITTTPATTSTVFLQTHSASSPTSISLSAQRSTTLRTTVATAATPATTNTVFLQPAQTHSASSPTCIRLAPQTCSASISAAIAGWVIAAASILVNGVLVIAMAAYCYKMRQRNLKQVPDIRYVYDTSLCEKRLQRGNNRAYGITQATSSTHYKNTSQQHQAKDSNAPSPRYENTPQ